MSRAQRHDWIDLMPALGLVYGGGLALVLVTVLDAADDLALAIVGGAGVGFLVGLVVQRRQHRSPP